MVFSAVKKTDSSDFSACDARLALLIDADSVFVDQRIQGWPGNAQQLGCRGDVVVGVLQGPFDRGSFRVLPDFLQVQWHGVIHGRCHFQIGEFDGGSWGHDHGAFDFVFQFADVAGPGIGFDGLGGFLAEFADALVVQVAEALQKAGGDGDGITVSFPERRDCDGHFADPVIQVASETFGIDQFLQILMGGADDPDIDGDFFSTADALYGPFLQKTQ